jgi:hypothetical protein
MQLVKAKEDPSRYRDVQSLKFAMTQQLDQEIEKVCGSNDSL